MTVAWLLESKRLKREFWLAHDQRAVDDLTGEGVTLPILMANDVELLAGASDETLHGVLNAAEVFPGTRVTV